MGKKIRFYRFEKLKKENDLKTVKRTGLNFWRKAHFLLIFVQILDDQLFVVAYK